MMRIADSERAIARKCKSVELLHAYIDHMFKRGFFGQMTVSWENGAPVLVKEHATLKMQDVEKLISK